jgi:hypothetical protein
MLPVNSGTDEGSAEPDFAIAKFLASDVRCWAQKRIVSSTSYYDADSGMPSQFSKRHRKRLHWARGEAMNRVCRVLTSVEGRRLTIL